ncbi:LytR/AlgR family response regulator transcription factor [Youxingia wuxianensis]|uniref:Stage 0 sporulation protein A homolog n=1 Tax=Youxingia wuxianensis TaxID=2763678 RepID=A0A926EP29_9FIRM|nr:LytTR family DNA-binding domain-containing protein [Youxingia wuxianensis]MBC8584092.1 response regulator transcription factor [Youxingia wuxianensis]
MFYVALCDDSKIDLQILTTYLSELKKSNYHMEVLTFNDGYELVKTYKNGRRFDLLVLDMCMDSINGIETAKLIREYDSSVPILIVTSTIQFAMDGYRVNAYRYILKPVEKESFLTEVRNILDQAGQTTQEYFTVSNESGITKIKMDDIYYFESDVRTINLHTKDMQYSFTGKISEIAQRLEAFDFVRAHKSYVVNLKNVKNIFKGIITMENNDTVFMSKHRSKEIYERFLSYTEKMP